MNAVNLVDALSALVTIAIFVWFFYGVWQKYVTDVTRQRLFELRDNLFDYALDHREFNDMEVAKEIRQIINSMIRFAHEADIVHFGGVLAFVLISKKLISFRRAAASVEQLLNSVPSEYQDDVKKIIYDAHIVLAFHVYRRSLLLILFTLIFVLPLLIVLILFASTDSLSHLFIRKFGRLINAIVYTEACENG
jgi:hypothetical protein